MEGDFSMKSKPYMNIPDIQNSNNENQAAQLAVIGGLISTLGDGLSTVAAAMALQEAQQQSIQNGNGNNKWIVELQNMQKRMDALERELKQIKKMLRANEK